MRSVMRRAAVGIAIPAALSGTWAYVHQASIRGDTCELARGAVPSGNAFLRKSVLPDRVDFETAEATAYGEALDRIYENAQIYVDWRSAYGKFLSRKIDFAGRSQTEQVFGDVIHFRGAYLGAKKVTLYGPPVGSPGHEQSVQMALQEAKDSVVGLKRFAKECE